MKCSKTDGHRKAPHQSWGSGDRFMEKVAGQTLPKRPSREFRASSVPSVKTLRAYQRSMQGRDEAIRAAYGAYTLGEIGRHFDLHYTTVSRLARPRG